MPRYRFTKKGMELVDAGSLNCFITINLRQIKAPTYPDVNAGESFTAKLQVWANIETTGGTAIFDSTNTEKVATHKIWIRKPATITITAEDWIEYRGIYYDIITVEELGMELKFLRMYAVLRGDKTRQVNFA